MSLGFGLDSGEYAFPDQFAGSQFSLSEFHGDWPPDLELEDGLADGNSNGLGLGSDTAAVTSGTPRNPVGTQAGNQVVNPADHLAKHEHRQVLLPAPPRPAAVGLGGGDNETEARRLRRHGRQIRQGSESSSPTLACHFLKSNPRKYSECRGFTLRRIKDVKQHLNRKHKLPEFYCDRCYQAFGSREEKTRHVRQDPPCEVREAPPLEGVTEQQREQLRLHHSRGRSVKEQWYDMWDVIFPGQLRPPSIFLDNAREARVRMLRRLWDERREEIVNNALNLDKHVEETMDRGVFNRVMETFLTHVERSESIDVDVTASDVTAVDPLMSALSPETPRGPFEGKEEMNGSPGPEGYTKPSPADLDTVESPYPFTWSEDDWPDTIGTIAQSQHESSNPYTLEAKKGGSNLPHHPEIQS